MEDKYNQLTLNNIKIFKKFQNLKTRENYETKQSDDPIQASGRIRYLDSHQRFHNYETPNKSIELEELTKY